MIINLFVLDYCCLFNQLKLYCYEQKPSKEKPFRLKFLGKSGFENKLKRESHIQNGSSNKSDFPVAFLRFTLKDMF